MADHIKLQALKKLTAILEGITPNNGYGHDLKGKVYRGRGLIGAQESLPCLNILESPTGLDGFFADSDKTIRKNTWILLLQGWVADDPVNPTDPAYALLADVQRRLSDIVATVAPGGAPKFPGSYNLGGLVSDVEIGTDVVRPPEEGVSSKAFFYMPIRLTVSVNLIDPTTKVD